MFRYWDWKESFHHYSSARSTCQLVNAIDFDTVMLGAHTPPYVIPTELAMAERVGASGKDLILATALGLEIASRIGFATPAPMQFVGRDKTFKYAQREGYAKTNFGAAAGAGKLLGLNAGQMANALAVAGHMSQILTWSRQQLCHAEESLQIRFPGLAKHRGNYCGVVGSDGLFRGM